jgi:AcrR family transcriptional regulator
MTSTAQLEPPWWRTPRGERRTRPPLTREGIVDAALGILDVDGVDALTVRRLGSELGTGAASLYWHIAGKQELGDLVYDRIMGEIELPAPDPSKWEDQLKDMARQGYRVMLSHHDAVRLSIGRPPAGPNTVRIVEWMLGLLRGAGIPDRIATYFGNTLGRFLDASVLEASVGATANDGRGDQEEMLGQQLSEYWSGLPADQFPNVTALASTFVEGDPEDLFEFGLDLLIRGLAAYQQPSSPRPERKRANGPLR